MPDDIRINIAADQSGANSALKELTEAVNSLNATMVKLGESGSNAGRQISRGMHEATGSTLEAREAARLLSEEAGVRLPRALSNVLARSETLGPLLATAFSGVALMAFIPIVEQAASKLTDFISNQFIYTSAMKAADDETKKLTATLLQYSAQFDAASAAINEFGKTGAALARQKLSDLSAALADNGEALTQHAARLQQAQTVGISANAEQNQKIINDEGVAVEQLMEQKRALLAQFTLATLEANKAQEDAVAKAAAEQKKTQEELAGLKDKASKLARAAADDDLKAVQRSDELMIKHDSDQLAAEEKLSTSVIERDAAQLTLNEALAEAAVSTQQILIAEDKAAGLTGKERTDRAALVSLIEQERDAKLAAIDDEISAKKDLAATLGAAGDTAGQNQAIAAETTLQAKRVEIVQAANAQIAASNDQTTKQETKELEQYLTKFNTEFASSFAAVTQGQETLGQASRKMFQTMETAALQSFARIALAEIEGETLHQSTVDRGKLTDAKAAAVKAWKWGWDEPFPLNVVLAPALAASAFAGALAFEQGGVVPETQMALVHEREMVLPAELSERVQNMTGDGGGGTHHHYHINAVDAKSFHQLLQRNPAALSAGVRSATRSGHLNLNELQRGK